MLSKPASANSWLTSISSFATKQACAQEFLLGEELNDIVVGLEQWLGARKHRLQELKKTRKRLEEDITAIKKYFALAGTRCRVGAGNAKLASLPSQIIIDEKEARPLLVMDVPDQCREILLGRSKYVIMSVPERGLPDPARSGSLDACRGVAADRSGVIHPSDRVSLSCGRR